MPLSGEHECPECFAAPAVVRLHRYAGLATALFLLVAGLSGALLAFNHELDAALNPAMLRVTRTEPGTLRQAN